MVSLGLAGLIYTLGGLFQSKILAGDTTKEAILFSVLFVIPMANFVQSQNRAGIYKNKKNIKQRLSL